MRLDGSSWRVEPGKTRTSVNMVRRVHDDTSIFSAGNPLVFVFVSHLCCAESALHHVDKIDPKLERFVSDVC
ncbi:hypothetical protein Y032_0231g2999 [Ancylostoma ceylanicum]|uniref:Uncharacterized protein n=1 Tax=Ancylostoma ceylanicum TaxID=53326 RepID=A0A016SGK4_9BILA|nr:hypothetical protein Y032_0231g2999 [Ancylostoma ceylanicum]